MSAHTINKQKALKVCHPTASVLDGLLAQHWEAMLAKRVRRMKPPRRDGILDKKISTDVILDSSGDNA